MVMTEIMMMQRPRRDLERQPPPRLAEVVDFAEEPEGAATGEGHCRPPPRPVVERGSFLRGLLWATALGLAFWALVIAAIRWLFF